MKTGIFGYTGRMGQTLIRELQSGTWKDLSLAGGCAPDAAKADYLTTTNAADLFKNADVLIDFTIPAATREHLQIAAQTKKPLVIGTTGLTPDDEKKIHVAAKQTAIVYSANMSVGVNILLALIEQAASRLGPEWDIEIFETHHKNKIDSPSGTALALGKAAKTGRGRGEFVTDRNGKRNPGDIGFAVQRGGDVVGEHTVAFLGAGERLELGHKATDRVLFARGALRAASWLNGKPPGLYTMRDVLGL